MTDDEFDGFVANADDELRAKQAELKRLYALGEMKRWRLEQETAKLQFFDDTDSLVLEADVIGIGSFSPKSMSWKWAWSNPSLTPELRERALPLKQLRALTSYDLFGNEIAFSIEDEAMAWQLTAIAVHHLGALGCYRAPSPPDGPHTYLAITSVKNALLGQ